MGKPQSPSWRQHRILASTLDVGIFLSPIAAASLTLWEPVVTAVDPGREFAFARTEPFAGTVTWRYTFVPEGTGTRVMESYEVTKKLSIVGWFIIGTLYGLKDRRSDLRASMLATLDRLAEITETAKEPARR